MLEAAQGSPEFDGIALACLRNLKDFLITNSAVTVPIVRSLTSSLQSGEIISECVGLIDGMANANPDLKKKVICLQFMEGLIVSAARLNDEDLQLNRILIALIKCFSRLDSDQLDQIVRLTKKVLAAKRH